MTSFQLLGDVTLTDSTLSRSGGTITPAPPKVRQVLTLLLLRANYVVSREALIHELWDENPPRSAVATVQTYIYHLRRFLTGSGLPDVKADSLRTRVPGYQLSIDPLHVDVTRFGRESASNREHHAAGRHEEALRAAHGALDLWNGTTALANVHRGRLLEPYAVQLEEQRLDIQVAYYESAFALGQHRHHVAGLRALVLLHPLNEAFHALLIEALCQCDRRSEALAAYQRLRRLLAAELGLSPSRRTQELQQRVLMTS